MDFNVDVCLGCKKLIRYTKFNLCDECRTLYFNRIREYLSDNKTSNNLEVARNLGISLKVVNFFIQEQSLVDTTYRVSQDNMVKVRTLTNIGNELSKGKNVSGMHFFNKNKR